MADSDWRATAVAAREALALLGHPIVPRCLPGESEPCGGSNTDHALAHLIALKAVTDHHLTHLSFDQDTYTRIYNDVRLDAETDCPNPPVLHD